MLGHQNVSINNFNPTNVTPHKIFNDLDKGIKKMTPAFVILNSNGDYLYTSHETNTKPYGCTFAGLAPKYWVNSTKKDNATHINTAFVLTKYPGEDNTYRLIGRSQSIPIDSKLILGEGICDNDGTNTKWEWSNSINFCSDDKEVVTNKYSDRCKWVIKILD